jgi:hypothetical protein
MNELRCEYCGKLIDLQSPFFTDEERNSTDVFCVCKEEGDEENTG